MSVRTQSRTTLELAGELRPAVLRLARRLRQMRDESVELTAAESSAMAILHLRGQLTMGELAVEEKVRPPTITRLVNGLEARGLVQRTPAPTDGRQSVVALTGAGRDLLLANRRLRNEWLADRLAELNPDERARVRAAIPVLLKVNDA